MAFVSKKFLISYQNQTKGEVKNELSNQPESLLASNSVIRRMLAQTKTISQIIAYIWLNADGDDLARQARDWFQRPTVNFDEIHDNSSDWDKFPSLAKLMGTYYDESTQYGDLLRRVFPDVQGNDFYKFPIFNRFDIESGIVLFETNVNIFNGAILDPDVNAPNLLTVEIAFPPCPKFDEATLTKRELREWLRDRDPEKFMADNAYIPTCSS